MSSSGTQIGQMDKLNVGDIIQMNTKSFPCDDPTRTFSGTPFPPRDLDPTIIRHTPDSPNFQYYRVEQKLIGKGSTIIPEARYQSKISTFIPKDHEIHGVVVHPISYNTPLLASQPRYTGIHWWINVTHMSVNQNVDGMPLRTITRLVKVDPPFSYVSLLSDFKPRESNLFRPSELELDGKDLCQSFEYEENIQKYMPIYSIKTGWLHNPRNTYSNAYSSDEDEDGDNYEQFKNDVKTFLANVHNR
tara:strand:+ start:561 stop:1298 length:738 start_codon:yes stop_codon:yes gene_type:complete